MSFDFYRAFEEKHRGPRELIKSRLRVYLPFVEPLVGLYDEAKAVDLGCGRGEWLELLSEVGFDAQGVDLDEGMLAACHELELKVRSCDAIEFLKELPDESQVLVSGFHLAEHISFSDLQVLVQEALRVLKSAGLLILETPNPENIVVGTSSFYLDPTHQRPIPPQLLVFLPEHYGFFRTKTLRLQESQDLVANREPKLLDVLAGVSPDYAVVAQKNADSQTLERFDDLFRREYGLNFETLAMRYDTNNQQNLASAVQLANDVIRQTEAQAKLLEQRVVAAEAQTQLLQQRAVAAEAQTQLLQQRAVAAEAQAQLLEQRAVAAEAQAQLLEQRAVAAKAQAQLLEQRAVAAEAQTQLLEQRAVAAEGRAQQAESMVTSLVGSRSWRLTWPLRLFAHLIRWIRSSIFLIPSYLKNAAKELLKPVLARAVSFALARPALKFRLLSWLRKYPTLDARLRRFAAARGLTQPVFGASIATSEDSVVATNTQGNENLTSSADSVPVHNELSSFLIENNIAERLSVEEILIRIRKELTEK